MSIKVLDGLISVNGKRISKYPDVEGDVVINNKEITFKMGKGGCTWIDLIGIAGGLIEQHQTLCSCQIQELFNSIDYMFSIKAVNGLE